MADKIRPLVDRYTQAFPALLEIPSKDHPYGELADGRERRSWERAESSWVESSGDCMKPSKQERPQKKRSSLLYEYGKVLHFA